MTSFEPADAAFDASAPVPATAEPALPLVRQSCRRFPPWPWQNDSCDASLLRVLFICRCRQFAIAGDQLRRAAKLLAVLIQAWDELGGIVGIAIQHPRLRNDAALGLGQPEH